MAGALSALGRWGQGLLALGGYGAPSSELRRVQHHLVAKEAGLAWHVGATVLASAEQDQSGVRELSTEALATLGVAAAAAQNLEEACALLQRACDRASQCTPEERAACNALKQRADALLAQSRGKQGLLCGPFWDPKPPAEIPTPSAWAPWVAAMPQVVEYVGPVEVRWMGDGASSGQRGLFTSRAVKAGELLLVSLPIAHAEANGEPLVQALRRACLTSGRARRRLACLLDGDSQVLSPEEVSKALGPMPDCPAEPMLPGQEPEGNLKLMQILNHNVFSMQEGFAGLYGMPSMLNHSCDGHGRSALKLVLVFFDKAIIFSAARDLEAGEELCHSYFDIEGSLQERQDYSKKWGFACACARCSFEATRLPGTMAETAINAAVAEFRDHLRFDMRALSGASKTDVGTANTGAKRWPLLQKLLAHVEAVEASVTSCTGWQEKELGWCLAIVQRVSSAALWCLLTHSSSRAGSSQARSEDEGAAPEDPLSLRCQVLKRLTCASYHTERWSFDHLQHLYLLHLAMAEARTSAVARMAMDAKPLVVEPMGEDMASTSAETVPAPWLRMRGSGFWDAVREKGLRALLEQAGGIVQVGEFLPGSLAEDTLETLKSLEKDEWILSANKSSVDADHRFWRYEGTKIDAARRVMQELSGDLHPILNGAKYDAGGKITLHNDAMRWVVQPQEVVDGERFPSGTSVFRKIALICYLTKDWSAEYGGCLVDNLADGPRAIVPEFNSLVAFLVPREHWVSEMKPGAPFRYTLFGWLHDREPYPDGAIKPLGSKNHSPPTAAMPSEEGAIAEIKGSESTVAAAEQARQECEHGFRMRFGISAEDLQLGSSFSPAKALLQRLAS
eukprot:TRINITY_DN21902_c0_g1_i1.p1 TRINITY_DN21902_c0_g1~~TRINITY_DN21902_c0_g1_i1.p1  ORF type:complete len:848 (-),score=186.14 TRINITY_DN21902_c0_g1_i1:58-2601(-)